MLSQEYHLRSVEGLTEEQSDKAKPIKMWVVQRLGAVSVSEVIVEQDAHAQTSCGRVNDQRFGLLDELFTAAAGPVDEEDGDLGLIGQFLEKTIQGGGRGCG